ncbi:MAG: RNA polymerase sigma-54 factor, partial [Pseudomonadota bacterium]
MTPQLMQAIKLLQFSHADLQAYVESEIEKNPLLQRVDDQEAGPDRGLSDVSDQSPDGTPRLNDTNGMETAPLMNGAGDDGDWIDKPLQNSAEAIASTFDTDAENVFPEDAGQAGIEVAAINGRDNSPLSSPMSQLGDNDYNLEAFVSETPTLTDHLTRQIGLVIEDPRHTMIARTLIDSVDNAGYLRSDLSDIAEALGVTPCIIEDILGRLQTLDPPGVFARDLSECLALQLKEKNRFDPAIAALIDNLDLLAKREFDRLQSLCGVDRDDLIEMIDEVRMLDPKPGEAFESVFTEIVVPDVIVQARPDGSWALELNSDTLPKVLVDQSYFAT